MFEITATETETGTAAEVLAARIAVLEAGRGARPSNPSEIRHGREFYATVGYEVRFSAGYTPGQIGYGQELYTDQVAKWERRTGRAAERSVVPVTSRIRWR